MSIRFITASRLLIAALLLIGPLPAWAHGVRGEYASGGMAVTATYSDGKPMSYARVDILAPGGGPTFQSGRTDRNGRFCFYPDKPGQWTVVVNDEIGHRLELAIPISNGLDSVATNGGSHVEKATPVWMSAAAGIGIILGLTGIFMAWRNRKRGSHETARPKEN
jgi:nickel transport protein